MFFKGLCFRHYQDIDGDNPVGWTDSLLTYPNSALFKKNRLIRFTEVAYRCQLCEGEAKLIHHIDGSKSNHELENLLPLCPKCHVNLHIKQKKAKYPEIGLREFAVRRLSSMSGLCRATIETFMSSGYISKRTRTLLIEKGLLIERTTA